MKRKSIVVAFGYYTLDGWNVEVVQITRTFVSQWGWISRCNKPSGHPEHRSIRQMRADCRAATLEQAGSYRAIFGGVRRNVYAKSARRLANSFYLPRYKAAELLDRAQAALGGIQPGLQWLSQPATALGGVTPATLARSNRGWFRVCDELIRRQFASHQELKLMRRFFDGLVTAESEE